jgi:hypothetical protein
MITMTMMVSGLSYINPADEWSNFGVNPQSELKRDIASNTPLAIPGGRLIRTGELESALKSGMLEGAPIRMIDVLRRSATTFRWPCPGCLGSRDQAKIPV